MTLVQPNPAQQEIIRKLLREDLRTRDDHLQAIKEWLRKQPHLPDSWDEQRLMTFLRGCMFSLEKTKRKLDMYFTMRAALPEFFTNRDVTRPEIQELLKIGQGGVLPGMTPQLYRVTVLRTTSYDIEFPKNFTDLFKLAMMTGDVRLETEETGVAGDLYLVDAGVANINHFLKVNPLDVKKFLICVQEAYPVKFKGIHLINAPPIVAMIKDWIKPFVKSKYLDRIHIHKTFDTLYEHIPKEMLPLEFGGTAGPMDSYCKAWFKKLEEYNDWFKEQESVKADETKRPGKATNYNDLFGVEGSFKRLAID